MKPTPESQPFSNEPKKLGEMPSQSTGPTVSLNGGRRDEGEKSMMSAVAEAEQIEGFAPPAPTRRPWRPRVTVVTKPDLPPLLTEAEAAQRLGVPPRRMQDWRRRGVGPTWLQLGVHVIRYQESDLANWQALATE